MWQSLLIVVLIVLIGGTWWWWRKAQQAATSDGDDPMYSLVLLLSSPRRIDRDDLQRRAEMAWSMRFPSGDSATEFVVGDEPPFIIQARGFHFIVHAWPQPYVEDPAQVAEELPELRLRKAMSEHRAWLSVDLLGVDEGTDIDAAYRLIGQLIAELVADDTLLIYAPQTGRVNTLDQEVLEGLATGNPLQVVERMSQPSVIPIESDDPRMVRAVGQAREQWPTFVEAFNRQDGESFAIKAPFGDDDDGEFMWIQVTRITPTGIHGTLGNDPVHVKGLKEGDEVTVQLDNLNDWMYFRDNKMVGGFTLAVLAPQYYEALKAGSQEE